MNQHTLKRLGKPAKSRSRTRLKESWFLLFITLYSTITKITSRKAKREQNMNDSKVFQNNVHLSCLVLNSSLSVSLFSCLKKKKTLFSYWTVREIAADRSFNSSSFHLDSGAAAPAINTFSRNTNKTK